jgi:hypothetical protein
MESYERPVPPVAYKNDRTSLPLGDLSCQILVKSIIIYDEKDLFGHDVSHTKELLKQCFKLWNFSRRLHVCK